MISEKGVHMYKGVGVCFADFIKKKLKKSYENEIIWSHCDQIFFHFYRIFKNTSLEYTAMVSEVD